jgi:hypothetical protein
MTSYLFTLAGALSHAGEALCGIYPRFFLVNFEDHCASILTRLCVSLRLSTSPILSVHFALRVSGDT